MDDCVLFQGEAKGFMVKTLQDNNIWIEPEDFVYSGYNSNKISYNALTGEFTNVTTDSITYSYEIVATHKVTGLTSNVLLIANPTASLIGLTGDSEYDLQSWIGNSKPYVKQMGYVDEMGFLSAGYSRTQMDSILQNRENNFAVIKTHGGVSIDDNEPYIRINQGGLGIYDADHVRELDLTNLKLIVFLACEAGVGGAENSNNMPNAAVDAGAKIAVGFKNKIEESAFFQRHADNWLYTLLKEMNTNKTFDEAFQVAHNQFFALNGMGSGFYVGDGTQIFYR